jgi:hypothetical protein
VRVPRRAGGGTGSSAPICCSVPLVIDEALTPLRAIDRCYDHCYHRRGGLRAEPLGLDYIQPGEVSRIRQPVLNDLNRRRLARHLGRPGRFRQAPHCFGVHCDTGEVRQQGGPARMASGQPAGRGLQ